MENHNMCIQRRVSLTNVYIIRHLKLCYSVRERGGLRVWQNVNCTIVVSEYLIVLFSYLPPSEFISLCIF
jgi:hypothetical protein